MAMAFVPTPPAAMQAEDKPKAALPVFGRRLHSRNRLDIRPVLWSLKNRPEEWVEDRFTITHKPSKHEFWTGNGYFFYGLYSTGERHCSCQAVEGGRFSLIQKAQFAWALMRWRWTYGANLARAELGRTNEQFANHFIRE